MKKRLPLLLLVTAAILGALLIAIPCYQDLPSSADREFEAMTEALFCSELADNTISLHYTLAHPEDYGIDDYEPSLGHISAEDNAKSAMLTENVLGSLATVDAEALNADNRLAYDILEHYLTTQLMAGDLSLYPQVLSPSSGLQSELPVLLAEYQFRSKQDVADYLRLLTDFPSYFSEIADYEKARAAEGLFMSDESAAEIVAQCEAFLNVQPEHYMDTTFQSRIAECSFLSEEEKQACVLKNRENLNNYVYPAYRQLAYAIRRLYGKGVNEGGLCNLPDGSRYYEYLVAANTGSSRSVPEIRQMLEDKLKADITSLRTFVQTHGAAVETAGIGDSTAPLPSPEQMLEDLKGKITKDFPVLKEIPYRVKYVDPSLEKFLSPAFYLTPAIDDAYSNVIYINNISGYSELNLYTTLAHEGYPGHLYQSVYHALHSEDAPLIRNILYFGGYVEGWALYVEMYSYDLAEGNEIIKELSRMDRSLQLCIYSLVDIGIHYDGWSLADTTAFLNSIGSFSEESCRSIYRYIVDEPSNYLKYYVGYLEICQLRDKAVQRLGSRFSLKDFHEFLLSCGPAPFSILEAAEEKWLYSLH